MSILNSTNLDKNLELLVFSWIDYGMLIMLLILSVAIGIYFGFFGTKQSTVKEYLLGDRNMNVIPIALSLVASNTSGVTMLAVQTDVYRFGPYYWFHCIQNVIVYLVFYYAFFPVFYYLQLTSIYEYLELRFNRKVKYLASFLNIIDNILYLPVIIYIPSLIIEQVTNINIHYATPVLCAICIFYTSIGGLKAVVWTDTLQFIVMVGSMITVLYLGIESVGGLKTVWNTSIKGERLNIDSDLDLTKRYTILSSLIGTLFSGLSYISINQGYVQKCLALPQKKDVKKPLLIFFIGMSILITISVTTGLVLYTKYEKCDPMSAGKIQQHDQIMGYYIMQISRHIPGLPGLYVSGSLSAALSTFSAIMNSLSAVIYKDFLSQYMPQNLSEKKISNILKLIVMIIGIMTILLVYLIEYIGNSLVQTIYILAGITAGPLLGLFSLGFLVPFANSKGALIGGYSSLLIMTFTIVGSTINKSRGYVGYSELPISISGCNNSIANSITNINNNTTTKEEVFYLFRIAYFYYIFMGTLIVFLIGIPISIFTNKKTPINPNLISPICRWMIRKTDTDKCGYINVVKANENTVELYEGLSRDSEFCPLSRSS